MANLDIKEELLDFVIEIYGENEEQSGADEADSEDQGIGDENGDHLDRRRAPSVMIPEVIYSPASSPEGCERRRSGNRDRSRSTLVKVEPQCDSVPSSSGISKPLNGEGDGINDNLTPDAYALFMNSELMECDEDEEDSDEHTESRRRGERRGRGRPRRSRGVGRYSGTKRFQWEAGYPLQELWPTDDDIPTKWKDLAKETVKGHKMKLRCSEKKVKNNKDNDVFHASDGRDNLKETEGIFEWFPMKSFRGKEEPFKPTHTGAAKKYETAYEAFRSYWDESLLQYIANETNRYATKISSTLFQSDWYDTNSHEILCLFSFWMMLGIIRMPTISTCFSMNPLLRTEIFRSIFTAKRYNSLLRALDFIDSDAPDAAKSGLVANQDRLSHLRPIITHLNAKFRDNYIPSKDICIDESVTLWKGKLNFKQYSRTQANNLAGIKTYELCESSTGYLWSFIVYSGKNSTLDPSENPMDFSSTAIVKTLISPLLNKGYRLFLDHWYNSPCLARFLKLNGTDCVGNLRQSCPDVPWIIQNAPLKRGQFIARHSGDVSVLSWEDTTRVHMISTCHGTAMGMPTVASKPTARNVPFKPQAVLDYDKFMGGVNLKDQMLEPYLLERVRCGKWYMKLFKRLVNCSILNARTLLESSTQSPQDHLTFRLQLVNSIITKHLSYCPQGRRFLKSRIMPNPARIVHHNHWPVRLEQTPKDVARNRQARQKCCVCVREGRKHQKTPYKCETCDVPLCAVECFKIYHTT